MSFHYFALLFGRFHLRCHRNILRALSILIRSVSAPKNVSQSGTHAFDATMSVAAEARRLLQKSETLKQNQGEVLQFHKSQVLPNL